MRVRLCLFLCGAILSRDKMPDLRRTLCGHIAYYIFISAFLIKNKNTIPKQKNKQKGA